jgi:hypothetical protein
VITRLWFGSPRIGIAGTVVAVQHIDKAHLIGWGEWVCHAFAHSIALGSEHIGTLFPTKQVNSVVPFFSVRMSPLGSIRTIVASRTISSGAAVITNFMYSASFAVVGGCALAMLEIPRRLVLGRSSRPQPRSKICYRVQSRPR